MMFYSGHMARRLTWRHHIQRIVLASFYQLTFLCLKKELSSSRICFALTEKNTLNPKHNTKTSFRNVLMCWAWINYCNDKCKFPWKKMCHLLDQFIDESLLHSVHELLQVLCNPVKQIITATTTNKPTKYLRSDNKKKGYEPQALPFHWSLFGGIVLGGRSGILFLVWWQ